MTNNGTQRGPAYPPEYYTFKVGDLVTFTSAAQTNGHPREGKIVGIWTGETTFAFPFSVKYESPVWAGEFVYAWAHPSEMVRKGLPLMSLGE